MTRRAIIISSDKTKHGDLPGARADVQLHQTFLKSPFGGTWSDSEIQVLWTPRASSVKQALAACEQVDYVFVAFSGHGEHVTGKGLNETLICLNDDEDLSVIDINPRNRRHVIVLDSCRSLRRITESLEKIANFAFANEASRPDPVACRVAFDTAVANAEEGRVVMYSCEQNQTAGDDPGGGVFTQALTQAGESWSVSAHRDPSIRRTGAVFGLDKAFAQAKTETYRVNAPQTAVWYPGRRIRHFPYAVVAKDI